MDIKIRMTKGDWNKTKAYFDVMFVGMSLPFNLTIKGCRLVEGENGLFVSLPSIRKEKDGEVDYQQVVYVNDDLKKLIHDSAKARYEDANEVRLHDNKEDAGYNEKDLPF